MDPSLLLRTGLKAKRSQDTTKSVPCFPLAARLRESFEPARVFVGNRRAGAVPALHLDDSQELFDGDLEHIVNQDVAELGVILYLVPSLVQPSLNYVGLNWPFGAGAVAESCFQNLRVWGEDKHRNCSRDA